MFKLVSQFDSVRSRSSLATPTCGCCSCCCCCVVTTLASSIITSRMFGKYANKNKLETAQNAQISGQLELGKTEKMIAPYVWGFFVIPITIVVSAVLLISSEDLFSYSELFVTFLGIFFTPLVLFGLFIYFVGRNYHVPKHILWLIIILTPILMAIELVIWLSSVFGIA